MSLLSFSRSASSSSSSCLPKIARSVVCASWLVASLKFATWMIASSGSTTRKYTTAFPSPKNQTAVPFTETLSREITSCGGTSNTRVLKSTRTICWIGGTTKISPGPFTPPKRPGKKNTPRSYSRRILIDEMARSASRTTMPPTKYISVPLRFDVQYKTLHACNAQRLAAAHRTWRAYLPLLAAHARPALALEVAERLAARTEHVLAPGDDRLAAAFQQHAEHENQEPGARGRHAGDERDRDGEIGQRRVLDQHDRAEHESNQAADAERAVRREERLRGHEADADGNHPEARNVPRQQR